MDTRNKNKVKDDKNKQGISRRDAIQKMGYAAFASSTMFLLLNNPTKVYATSQLPPDPGDDDPFSGTKSGETTGHTGDPWAADNDPWK